MHITCVCFELLSFFFFFFWNEWLSVVLTFFVITATGSKHTSQETTNILDYQYSEVIMKYIQDMVVHQLVEV